MRRIAGSPQHWIISSRAEDVIGFNKLKSATSSEGSETIPSGSSQRVISFGEAPHT